MSKFIHIYLYGSIHIGLCALAMTWQSLILLNEDYSKHLPYLISIFTGTVGLYSIHRITDLDKMARAESSMKYIQIESIRAIIKVIIIVSIITSLILLLFLPFHIIILLGLGAFVTYSYTSPIFTKLKKLKDYQFLKIFLIAIIWGMVTAGIPAYESGLSFSQISIFTLERSLFIFALTLPFDIRDLDIDKSLSVLTIPAKLGKQRSLRLSILVLLIIQPMILWYLSKYSIVATELFYTILITNIIISLFVWRSKKIQEDFYYTGVLDGMMIFQFLIILLMSL